MQALINLAVAETNTAYCRSGIIPRLAWSTRRGELCTESGDFRRTSIV